MSVSVFPVDMDRIPEHVDTCTQPLYCVASDQPKTDLNINGLTSQIASAMATKGHLGTIVIVSSEQNHTAASFQESLKVNGDLSTRVLQCKGPGDLSHSIISSLKYLVLLVDDELYNTLTVKRRLHDSVYEFMEALEESGKYVYVINQMDSDDHRVKNLFYQLPASCARWWKEIAVKTIKLNDGVVPVNTLQLPSEARNSNSNATDNSMTQQDLVDNNTLNENRTKKTDTDALNNGAMSELTIRKVPVEGERLDNTFKKMSLSCVVKEPILSKIEVPLAASVPRQVFPIGTGYPPDQTGVKTLGESVCAEEPAGGNTKSLDQQTHPKTLVAASGTGEPPREAVLQGDQDDGNEHEQEEQEEESASEDNEDGSDTVTAVQIGSHSKMNINLSDGQCVIAKQDGSDNTISVNIVPTDTKSKTIVVVTTNPSDPALDQLLVKEISDQCEIINISMRSLDASLVRVSSGSIVLELEVKPGQKMDNDWLKKLLKMIFNDKVTSVLPEGTVLSVDIESKMVLPIDQLGQYVYLNQEDLHKNCVSMKKYDEKVKEVHVLEKKLIFGILANPKHDLVLQKALRNFVSSIVSDICFTFTTLLDQEEQESEGILKADDSLKFVSAGPILESKSKIKDDYMPWSIAQRLREIGDAIPLGASIEEKVQAGAFDKGDQETYEAQIGQCIQGASVENQPSTVVMRVLAKEHRIGKRRLKVSLYSEDRPSVRTIAVRGARNLSNDALKFHFEIRNRSGGGRVTEVRRGSDPDVALVTFDKAEAVKHVIAKAPHGIGDTILDVSAYADEKLTPKTGLVNTIVVRGVGSFSDDYLEMYFENRRRSGGGEVKEVRRGSDPDVAYVTFEDDEAVKHVIAKAPHVIGDTILDVSAYADEKLTPKTGLVNTIVVRGVGSISDETFVLYFENRRRSGGGEVKEVRRGSDPDVAYVTFEDDEDVCELTDLEREIVSSLQCKGDIVTTSPSEKEAMYQRYSSSVHRVMGDDVSWQQISLLFQATKKALRFLGSGTKMASFVKDMTARYMSEEMSSWIIKQGGWEDVMEDPEFELD